jgi:hypothetical protein
VSDEPAPAIEPRERAAIDQAARRVRLHRSIDELLPFVLKSTVETSARHLITRALVVVDFDDRAAVLRNALSDLLTLESPPGG